MTLPARSVLIAAAVAVVALATVLVLPSGSSLSAADRRLIDRREDALDICFAADLATLDKAAGCMQGKRLREEIEARGLCLELTERTDSYRSISRCDG